MAKGEDLNNNGIPDALEGGVTRPSQVTPFIEPSTYQEDWEAGGGSAESVGSGLVKIPVRDANGNLQRVDPDQAKAFWEVQAVQGTEAWQKASQALKSLGYKTNSQMLSALNRGIDYTQNPGSATEDPFTWITAQEARGSSGGSGSSGPYTQVQESTRISSPSAARTTANAAFESQIGRMATKDESTQFQQALNIAEQGSPSTSVTSGVSSGRNTTASTKTTGGFDAAAFGRDWARSQSDFAESYAAGSFMGLLDKVISQPNAIEQIMKGLA